MARAVFRDQEVTPLAWLLGASPDGVELTVLNEPLVAAIATSCYVTNDALWLQCLRGLGQSLGTQLTLRDAGRTGEICAQILALMAADFATKPSTPSLLGVLQCHGCSVEEWMAALFTEDVRRQFMSVRPTPFADVQKITFGRANARVVAKAPRARAGATDQVSESYRRQAQGRVNLLQFIEMLDDVSLVSQEKLLDWFQQGLGILCRPNQPDIDLLIPVLLDKNSMLMTLIVLQVKNQAAGSRPTDIKVRAPGIVKSPVPRLFLWIEMDRMLQDGVKAGQYHFEGPQENEDPSQVNFFCVGTCFTTRTWCFSPFARHPLRMNLARCFARL